MALARHAPALTLWKQWDAQWYLGIAAHGYGWTWHGKSPLAFFPLYPATIHLAERVGVDSLVAALCLANLAFGLALWFLFRLTSTMYSSATARKTVWLLAFLPTGFFFAAPYSESFFLLCAIAALSSAAEGRSLRAGVWTSAALLTRSTGLVVFLAVATQIFITHRRPQQLSSRPEHEGRRTSAAISAAALVFPCAVVVIAWLTALHSQGIPAIDILHAQRAWHRSLTLPWVGFTASLHWLVVHGPFHLSWAIENVLQLIVTATFLVLTVKAWPELQTSGRVYCLAFWMLSLSSPEWLDGYYAPLSSMTRFVLVLFPLYMWAALKLNTHAYKRVLMLSMVGYVACSGVYLAGGWVG